MQHADLNKAENDSCKAGVNKNWKISPLLKAYIDAKNELIAKYAVNTNPALK